MLEGDWGCRHCISCACSAVRTDLQSSMPSPPFPLSLLNSRIPVTMEVSSLSCLSLSTALSAMNIPSSVCGKTLCSAAVRERGGGREGGREGEREEGRGRGRKGEKENRKKRGREGLRKGEREEGWVARKLGRETAG